MKTTNTIDWTKPLRTKETPPRAVEIITHNGRSEGHPIMGYIGNESSLQIWSKEGRWMENRTSDMDLENVPEWEVSDEPWAAEKAAFAEGKTIQYRSLNTDGWEDLKNGPLWVRTENYPFKPEYRVKPEPIKVPLELEDVPPNSVIRVSSNKDRWYLILSANPFGVVTSIVENLSFRALMEKQWEIKRPNQDWEPCYKMIEPVE